MENVEAWIKTGDGSGYGYGDGSGYGSGYGYGYGYGDGSGYGYGDGYGSGYGYGYGDGSGYGSGYGYGYGDGDGSGYGYGDGYGSGYGDGSGYGYGDGSGLKKINDDTIYKIDGVPTVIKHIKGNIAKGYVLNSDLSINKCYIAKRNGYFAHGESIKVAIKSLEDKILMNMDIDEKIDTIIGEYEKDKEYPNKTFFSLHNFLTGSCEMGRNKFVREHNIDLEGKMTVDEFINLTENDYGSDIIKQFKEKWENKHNESEA